MFILEYKSKSMTNNIIQHHSIDHVFKKCCKEIINLPMLSSIF